MTIKKKSNKSRWTVGKLCKFFLLTSILIFFIFECITFLSNFSKVPLLTQFYTFHQYKSPKKVIKLVNELQKSNFMEYTKDHNYNLFTGFMSAIFCYPPFKDNIYYFIGAFDPPDDIPYLQDWSHLSPIERNWILTGLQMCNSQPYIQLIKKELSQQWYQEYLTLDDNKDDHRQLSALLYLFNEEVNPSIDLLLEPPSKENIDKIWGKIYAIANAQDIKYLLQMLAIPIKQYDTILSTLDKKRIFHYSFKQMKIELQRLPIIHQYWLKMSQKVQYQDTYLSQIKTIQLPPLPSVKQKKKTNNVHNNNNNTHDQL